MMSPTPCAIAAAQREDAMSPTRRRRRATAAWEGRPTIRVATLPGRGLYARHLSHPEGIDGVHHVTVGQAGAPRPPSALDPAWLAGHLDEVDVVHAIAAPATLTTPELADVVRTVKESGTPLVLTAYHLRDPHGLSGSRFDAQLDVLVPAADAVVTLTEAAADEIRGRWDVEARVLPHPHAVDFVRMRQHRPRFGSRFKVGVHLGNLRTAIDPPALLAALAEAVDSVDGGCLVVTVNDAAADRGSSAYDPVRLRAVEDAVRGVGVVRVSRPLSEPSLWDYLFGLELCVLPGVRGSHSVWPEACFDLGTQLALPGATHAARQQESHGFDLLDDEHAPDPASVVSAVKEAASVHRSDGTPRADPLVRWQQRVDLAEALRCLYASLTGLERR
jgi:hypothetical protein